MALEPCLSGQMHLCNTHPQHKTHQSSVLKRKLRDHEQANASVRNVPSDVTRKSHALNRSELKRKLPLLLKYDLQADSSSLPCNLSVSKRKIVVRSIDLFSNSRRKHRL